MDKRFEDYKPAPLSLLDDTPEKTVDPDIDKKLREKAFKLEETFRSFGIEIKVIGITHGANVTRFECTVKTGTRISRIYHLQDELRLEMAVISLRIVAPVPGKSCIAIEIPNEGYTPVRLKDLVETDEFKSSEPLTAALGEDLCGCPIYCDIAKMPHLLIAGAVGSGKQLCICSILASILMHSSPEDVRMILVDTHIIEFYTYNGIPHLLLPVINDPGKAVSALNWALTEMLRRYELFEKEHVRDIKGYNEKHKKGTDEHLPYILIVIDDISELMLNYSKEFERCISAIAARSRAAGIHIIMATQRPSCDVITGVVKANIGSRIAFAVINQTDSKSIIDESGAEKLLGRGDMLYCPMSAPYPIRAQGSLVREDEVDRIVDYLRKTYGAMYDDDVARLIETNEWSIVPEPNRRLVSDAELFNDAVEAVLDNGSASVSVIQRTLGIGYPAAARLIDMLEKEGIIAPFVGSKPRQILITEEEWKKRKYGENGNE